MVKERRWSGKEFQILGAATRKLRLPSSDLVVGTYKSPRCAERRPTLPLTVDRSITAMLTSEPAVSDCVDEWHESLQSHCGNDGRDVRFAATT